MPSKSGKQHRMMEAIAHGAKPKGGSGPSQGSHPSQAVAKEFAKADAKQGKYQGGHKQGKGKR